jgi:hypothetical protein
VGHGPDRLTTNLLHEAPGTWLVLYDNKTYMSNIKTIQIFTAYQVSELEALFNSGAQVVKLGICLEDKSIIAEYICWRDTKTIWIFKDEGEVINEAVEQIWQDNTEKDRAER